MTLLIELNILGLKGPILSAYLKPHLNAPQLTVTSIGELDSGGGFLQWYQAISRLNISFIDPA